MKEIDDAKILELKLQGLLHREIADQLGYSVSTVTRHLLDMGYKSLQPIDKEEVVRLHMDGVCDKEIAERLGCTRPNITHILNKLGYVNRKSKIDNVDLRNRISRSLVGRYTGASNPNYKGRANEMLLARGMFKTLSKNKIRNSDYTCSACGQRGGDLVTHHIKPLRIIMDEFMSTRYDGNIDLFYEQLIGYRDFVDEDNMVVLCRDCHHNVHYSDNHELSPYRWESATTIERGDSVEITE